MNAPFRVPKYRHHRGSGQAFVQFKGRRIYLGKHGSDESRERYRRFVAELSAAPSLAAVRSAPATAAEFTVVELTAAYRDFAKGYYRKNGETTGHIYMIWRATEVLADLYGRTTAAAFGPLSLQAIQDKLTRDNASRTYINDLCAQIKRVFKWGVVQELVPATVYMALAAVPGLKRGRCEAREPEPVLPVDDEIVDATLSYLPPVVADMVRLQRMTGMRPGELCILRPCDVDRSGDVWMYTPESHKTQHHGKERKVFIGPKAQDVLRQYLLRDSQAYCFSPADSERQRHQLQRLNRRSPLTPSQRARKPKANRKRKPRDKYDNNSYRRAISRAVALANRERLKVDPQAKPLPDWHPNQLRHTAATEIRKQFGLEAAQVALGHSAANVTQIYAERDYGLAAQVAKAIG